MPAQSQRARCTTADCGHMRSANNHSSRPGGSIRPPGEPARLAAIRNPACGNSKDDDILSARRWTMKAIVVTNQAAGTAGMQLVDRPEPQAAINDVVVQVHASGFVPTELTWPSTWTDRLGRDRTPSIPGHELAGVVTALGYGTTGLSVGQRVFGLADWYRD